MSVGRQAALGYTFWPSGRSVAAKGASGAIAFSLDVPSALREAAEKVPEQSRYALDVNYILGIADDCRATRTSGASTAT